jgi:hypothetical protein
MSVSNGNSASATETLVFRAVDRVNELLAETQQLTKNRTIPLMEDGTVLDSLAIINLLVFIEDEIRDAFGREVTLAGEDGAGSLQDRDLKTLGSLIDALQNLLAEPAR